MRTRLEPVIRRTLWLRRIGARHIGLPVLFWASLARGRPEVLVAPRYAHGTVGLAALADDGDGEAADVGDATVWRLARDNCHPLVVEDSGNVGKDVLHPHLTGKRIALLRQLVH